jgi:hypothetical protein
VIEQELFVEVLTKFWSVNENKWNENLQEELLNQLKRVSFFKRFAKSILVIGGGGRGYEH